MLKSHISETFVKRLVQKYQDKGLTFACKLLIEYSLLKEKTNFGVMTC